MAAQKSKIIYTLTDEAPYLATCSFLPILRTFAAPAGIDVVESDTDENDDNDSNDANPGAIELDTTQKNDNVSEGTTIEWDLTKKLDDDDQMKLF